MGDRADAMQDCLREIDAQILRIENCPLNQGSLTAFLNGGTAHYAILQLRTVASRIKAKLAEAGSE